MLRWGLIPAWTEDIKKLPLLLNAKSETAATKPFFRSAFKRRRCLVIADGYYEWKAIGKKKQQYYHRLTNDSLFAFAGLWERWEKGEKPVESCTIMTTDANSLASAVHDRMPVILPHAGYEAWLDPEIEDVAALQELLCPYPAKETTAYPVNPIVNKAGNEGPECIAAVKVEE
jgi:putative SOS response-associated peptidase YedK